jgi:hypothetical protein
VNKSVCLKCYAEGIVALKDTPYIWWNTDDFSSSWDQGTIICPHHIVFSEATKPGTWTVHKEQAWEQCPRKLEHAVADSVNIDKNK